MNDNVINVDFSHRAITVPKNPSKWDIIPIHNSDRAAFKFCRRQWAWGSPSRLNLIPKAEIYGVEKNLWFGTGIHYALEQFYNPMLKRNPAEAWLSWFELQWNGGIVTEDEVKQFADRNPQLLKDRHVVISEYKVDGLADILPDTYMNEEMFMGFKDLGVGMMNFYKDYAEANDNFTVISLEHDFSIPVLDPEGKPYYAVDTRLMPKGWQPDFDAGNEFGPLMRKAEAPFGQSGVPDYYVEKQVHLRGRMDMIIQDQEHGRFGIVDHKAQPLDEPVLTPDGFVDMGSLKVGDNVIGSNGNPTNIINIFPQGELDCYEITFSDRTHTFCSREHLWTTFSNENWRYKEPKVRTLEQLMSYRAEYGWQIPLTDPVEFEEKEYFLHPYVIGVLLGDGCLKNNSPGISCADHQIIEEVAELLPLEVEIKQDSLYNYTWSIVSRKEDQGGILVRTRNNTVKSELRKLGLDLKGSYDKFIPKQYLFGSVEQRIALLQGLLDTDGNVYEGRATFKTTSTDLVEGIEFLVRSLGGITRTNWNGGTNVAAYLPLTYRPYRMHISLPKSIAPFRLKRKLLAYEPAQRMVKAITEIKHVGKKPMQCIQVEATDGLYLTRDFIVTHNTASSIGEDYFRHLDLDEQCTSYLSYGELEARLHNLEYRSLEFITYQAILKGYPKPPTMTQKGLPSINRNEETTTAEMFAKCIKDHGLEMIFNVDQKMQAYYTYLLEQGDKRYIQRTDTWRNRAQKYNAIIRAYYEARDMLNDPVAYPSPSKNYGCLNCRFRGPCIAAESGDDYIQILEDGYMPNWDR